MTPDPGELVARDTPEALVRHTAVMSVGTALSRLTGMLRVVATAAALGVSVNRLADAYNTANTTPNIVYELVLGGVLSSVFVPVFVEWLQTKGRDEAWDVARRVMTIALVVLTSIMVIGIIGARFIIDLYTVGIEDPAKREVVRSVASFFLVFFMPQIVFYGLGAVASGLLNAHRRFAAPMFAPILNNLIVIATMAVFAAMPGPAHPDPVDFVTTPQKLVLAIGTTLGIIAMTVVLWPSLRRLGFRWRWARGWRHEAVLRIGRLARWVVVYVVVNQIGYVIVVILALRIQGGYTVYSYAFILFQLPHAIFAVSIFTALLPAMSSRWADGDLRGFRRLLAQGIRTTAFIALPAAAGYVVLARPVTLLLLAHGATTLPQAEQVARVLPFFSLGLLSFSTFQLLLRAYYAAQDSRTPALVNVGANAANITVNLFLVFVVHLGIRGLALGHATAYTAGAIALLVVMRRRLDGIEGVQILASIGRTLVATTSTALVAWATARAVGEVLGTATFVEQLAQVGAAVVVGLLAFVLAALILRADEVDAIRVQLAARWRR